MNGGIGLMPRADGRPTEAAAHVTVHGNTWGDVEVLDALRFDLDAILDQVAREHGGTISWRTHCDPELENDMHLAVRQGMEDDDAAAEGREPVTLSRLVFRRAVGGLDYGDQHG